MNASIAPSTAIVGYSSEYGRGFRDGLLMGIAIGLKMAQGNPPQAQPQPVVTRVRASVGGTAARKPFYQMSNKEIREAVRANREAKRGSQNGNSGTPPPCPPTPGPEPKPEPVEVIAARHRARRAVHGIAPVPGRRDKYLPRGHKLFMPGQEIEFNAEAKPTQSELEDWVDFVTDTVRAAKERIAQQPKTRFERPSAARTASA